MVQVITSAGVADLPVIALTVTDDTYALLSESYKLRQEMVALNLKITKLIDTIEVHHG